MANFMEHRMDRRIKLSMSAEIWLRGDYLSCFKTEDIGLGGLGLFGVDQRLCERDLVTVKAGYNYLAQSWQFERKAMVVYRDDRRLGMMWIDSDTNFTNTLADVEVIAA